jgi:serine/threonine-protein kinase HipA
MSWPAMTTNRPATTISRLVIRWREQVFLIQRFDRSPTGHLHVEDLAQVADAPPAFKYGEFGASYESVGRTIRSLAGEDAFRDYVRRLVAMVVVGNTDAHLKNWALIYPDGRTPMYDFHSLTVYSTYRYQGLALSLAGQKAPGQVDLENFKVLAQASGFDAQWTEEIVGEAVDDLRRWLGRRRRGGEDEVPRPC